MIALILLAGVEGWGIQKKVGGREIYKKLIYERETCKKIYFPNFEHTNSLNLFI